MIKPLKLILTLGLRAELSEFGDQLMVHWDEYQNIDQIGFIAYKILMIQDSLSTQEVLIETSLNNSYLIEELISETSYGIRVSVITEIYGESLYSDPIFVNSMCCVNLYVASICGFNDKYFDVTGNYTGAHVENGGSISFVYTHSTNSDITIEIVNDQVSYGWNHL